METIRNYLETMFQNLPNTKEVQKAKYELGQMMEDKYSELRNEGKTENEAIGVVISEFGNLEDIAEDLGISSFVKEQEGVKIRKVSMQETKDYIRDKIRTGILIGIGVFLCIVSPSGLIATADYGEGGNDAMGLVFLFLTIASAVGLFIYSGAVSAKWEFLEKEVCSIDFSTTDYIHHEKENYRMTNAMMNAIGVVLCILSVIPVVVMSELEMPLEDTVGVVFLLVCVAVGVFLLVTAGVRNGAYNTLLKVNDANSVGGNFVYSQKNQVRYSNKTVAAVMSVYWPTITCIYLCWSFLSGDWHISWIIWVIAGLVEEFIKNLYRD